MSLINHNEQTVEVEIDKINSELHQLIFITFIFFIFKPATFSAKKMLEHHHGNQFTFRPGEDLLKYYIVRVDEYYYDTSIHSTFPYYKLNAFQLLPSFN